MAFGSLLTTTIREFDGGLNVVNSDLNMDTRYSKVETNIFNNVDGTKSKRYGTKFYLDVKKFPTVTETFNKCEVKTTKTLSIKQPSGSYVAVGSYKVSIISPSNIAGDYKVEFANTKNFQINLNESVTESSFSEVKYKYRTDVERSDTNCPVTSSKLLKFTVDEEHNRLLIGNKLTVTNNTELNGEYSVVSSTFSEYYIDVSSKNVSGTINNLTITHDNRNIKGTRLINGEYFIDKIIAVSDIGEVIAIDGDNNAIIIWNDNISKTVNKEQPEGWHETTSVCFAVFNGTLTVWNGRDKPLAIDLEKEVPCNYLIDEGTGSNANVPIAKYALAFNHYLVAANIYDELDGKYYPDRISISSRDSIGTFYSDDANDIDNDGVYVDLGKIISSNKQIIKGISRYRNQIAVGFDDVVVFGTLGVYEEVTKTVGDQEIPYKIHTPQFEDVIDGYGCISNRSFMSINSELCCLDYSGLPIFKRASLTGQVTPYRISDKVAPEVYKQFIGLTESAIEDRIFCVNNPKDSQYLLFIPNNSEYNDTTETICYAYTLRNGARSSASDGAWSKFTGWNFQFGVTSALNTVFLCNGTKFYILGNIDSPYYADFMDDPDYPVTEDDSISGKEIEFDWEFPWADFNDRSATKHSRYLSLSTTGTSNFNLDFFIDYIYNNTETNEKDPQLTIELVAGDSPGWGGGKQHYGAGRRTNTELLFAFPCKFKIAKFRIYGKSKEKLNVISLTLYYQKGNIRR